MNAVKHKEPWGPGGRARSAWEGRGNREGFLEEVTQEGPGKDSTCMGEFEAEQETRMNSRRPVKKHIPVQKSLVTSIGAEGGGGGKWIFPLLL